MVDDLSGAINHYKEKAQMLRGYTKPFGPRPVTGAAKTYIKNCLERAAEHEKLAGWLEELVERREADKWIPVSERLPENDGWYLISDVDGIITTDFFDTEEFSGFNVTHWRPLPKAPESEAENE